MQGNGLRCSCRSCAGQCVPGEKLDLIENFLPDLYLLYVFVPTDLFRGLEDKMFLLYKVIYKSNFFVKRP
jgi:hypothetical protein